LGSILGFSVFHQNIILEKEKATFSLPLEKVASQRTKVSAIDLTALLPFLRKFIEMRADVARAGEIALFLNTAGRQLSSFSFLS